MENFTDVKLEIFVPQEHALKIRDELAKIGVGKLGITIIALLSLRFRDISAPWKELIPLKEKLERSAKVEYKSKSIANVNW